MISAISDLRSFHLFSWRRFSSRLQRWPCCTRRFAFPALQREPVFLSKGTYLRCHRGALFFLFTATFFFTSRLLHGLLPSLCSITATNVLFFASIALREPCVPSYANRFFLLPTRFRADLASGPLSRNSFLLCGAFTRCRMDPLRSFLFTQYRFWAIGFTLFARSFAFFLFYAPFFFGLHVFRVLCVLCFVSIDYFSLDFSVLEQSAINPLEVSSLGSLEAILMRAVEVHFLFLLHLFV